MSVEVDLRRRGTFPDSKSLDSSVIGNHLATPGARERVSLLIDIHSVHPHYVWHFMKGYRELRNSYKMTVKFTTHPLSDP